MNKPSPFKVIVTLGIMLSWFPSHRVSTGIAQIQPDPPPSKTVSRYIIPELFGEYVYPGYALNVTVYGDYAYIVDNINDVPIIEITNPAKPSEIGLYDTPDIASDVAIARNYAVITEPGTRGGQSQLVILDISNPAAPTEVGSYPTLGSATAVAVAGNYAYVADGFSVFRVFDISHPASPIETGFLITQGYTSDVAVAGNYAYVANAEFGLRIIDISDPVNPREVGFSDTPGFAGDVAVSGRYAYIADWESVRIIDVSNPTSPTEVGFYPTSGYVEDVEVAGSFAYVATEDRGLRILDISNPSSPIEAMSGDNPFGSLGLAVNGNFVYSAAFGRGLQILRLLADEVTGSIPIAGGSLTSSSGDTEIIFPTNALTQTVNVSYQKLLNDENDPELAGIGHTFDITAVYSDTGKAASLAPGQTYSLTVNYSDSDIGGAIENTLALYAWDGSTWVKESTSAVDTDNHIVTATPDHLSLWTVYGETVRLRFPLIRKRVNGTMSQ